MRSSEKWRHQCESKDILILEQGMSVSEEERQSSNEGMGLEWSAKFLDTD